MSYLVTIENYVKNYKNLKISHSNIIIKERVTMIKGSNGSGKSTLIRSIVGVNKYVGLVEVNGKISYCEEHPTFPKDCTVKCFLETLSKHDCSDYHNLMEIFDINHKLEEKINSLSKGMKSKLNLVQCLMRDADIYVLDEPFSGLDKESSTTLANYINLSKKAFIITTHINAVTDSIKGEIIEL